MTRRGLVIAILAIWLSRVRSYVRTNSKFDRLTAGLDTGQTVKTGGLFNHGMWPWSHCTGVDVRPAFAGHQGQRRRLPKKCQGRGVFGIAARQALLCKWIRSWLTWEEALNMLQRWCVDRGEENQNPD